MKEKLLIYLVICFTFIGCATIFKGSSADIRVNSSPSGATVTVNQINRGVTPQTLSLKRDQNYLVEFSRDGYETVRIQVNKDFDVATTVVGNLFSWWLLGVIVDVASGAAYSLEPADLQANLAELQANNIIPKEFEPKEDEIFVFMMIKEEWATLSENDQR